MKRTVTLSVAVLIVGLAWNSAPAAPIHQAVSSNQLATVEKLIEADSSLLELKDRNGYTPLHYAAQNRRTEIVKYLLGKQANVNAKTKYSYTPLHFAVMSRSEAIYDQILAQKPNLELKDNAGNTPLFTALQYGNKQAFNKLIAAGANFKTASRYKQTLLHLACSYGRADIAETLIKRGVAIDSKDNGGRTPLFLAAQSGQAPLIKMLLAKGADADVRVKNNYQPSPLFAACQVGNVEVVNLLLAQKVSVSLANPNGDQPLHIAANLGGQYYGYHNSRQTAAMRQRFGTVVAALLKAEAPANVENKQKKTPLQLAVAQNNYGAVNALVGRTKNLNINPATGETLFHWSSRLGLDNVVARSEEHTSELQSRRKLVCRLLLEKKKTQATTNTCRTAARCSN